ncbi:dihydrofolate reductase [Leisingera sp.]|uniref:dihydrofolate reductase n=1 Tax=Leisingera sp. TaxID=1879318 RepID=UPI003A8FDBD7
MITLIAARARNGAIGKDNDIPWFAPEDLKAFQRETLGGALIMGRNTWDSLPVKPLKNRLNLVVSSNPEAAETVLPSVTAAVAAAQVQGYRRIYGIGGEGIYREMLAMADRLLITEVDLEIADADAYFPDFSAQDWHRLGEQPLRAEDPACVMVEYLRKTPRNG